MESNRVAPSAGSGPASPRGKLSDPLSSPPGSSGSLVPARASPGPGGGHEASVESGQLPEVQTFFASLDVALPGEEVWSRYSAMMLYDLQAGRPTAIPGYCYLTNYRLGFAPKDRLKRAAPVSQSYTSVPLCTIHRVTKTDAAPSSSQPNLLEVVCKDCRVLRFAFQRGSPSRRALYEHLSKMAFPVSNDLEFFAFQYKPPAGAHSVDGWSIYSPTNELRRLGIPSYHWRITHINENFEMCDTYPSLLAVPASLNDETLRAVAAFRSRGRIPALSWKHPANQATITRCSQPRVGMSNKRCREDEQMVQAILDANPMCQTLHIMDARPKANALGNQVKGAGFESGANYRNISLSFMNIENIHAMRDSQSRVREAIHQIGRQDQISPNTHWYSWVDSSSWLGHVKNLLWSTLSLVRKLEDDAISVLIHCSDGWDRTAQQSSLAMLCLDPYYRTLSGFALLVEKEWCSFGHRFSLRTGHGSHKHGDEQRSPIFLQFVECVWQLAQQFPDQFEFNELFLVHVMDHLYSCRFGTFLCNNQKERSVHKVVEETQSLWSELLSAPERYTNKAFVGVPADPLDRKVLRPDPNSPKVQFWGDWYLRWTVYATVPDCSLDIPASLGGDEAPKADNAAAEPAAAASTSDDELAALRRRIKELEAESASIPSLLAEVNRLRDAVNDKKQ